MTSAKAYMALGNFEHAMKYAQTAQKHCLGRNDHIPTATSTLWQRCTCSGTSIHQRPEALCSRRKHWHGAKYLQPFAGDSRVQSSNHAASGRTADVLQALDEAEIIATRANFVRFLSRSIVNVRLFLPICTKADAALDPRNAVAVEQRDADAARSATRHNIDCLKENTRKPA